jgi:hypothetical protein
MAREDASAREALIKFREPRSLDWDRVRHRQMRGMAGLLPAFSIQLRPAGRNYANWWSQACGLVVASMRLGGRKHATGPTQGCDAR